MEIDVIVEKVESNGFRARVSTPELLSVEGPTRDAVMSQMEVLLRKKLAEAEVVKLNVPTAGEQEHPWLRFAGTWKNRPDIGEVLENMREYRLQVDADPERL